MHALFIPYGTKNAVDFLIQQMQCQDWQLPIKMLSGKHKGRTRFLWIKGQVRILPFGVMELIFPKEQKDLVLASLDFHLPNRYAHEGLPFKLAVSTIRKALGAKPAPKFDSSKKLMWHRTDINFIPIGIREDVDTTYILDGEKRTHEGL